jgi:hypothetical protein
MAMIAIVTNSSTIVTPRRRPHCLAQGSGCMDTTVRRSTMGSSKAGRGIGSGETSVNSRRDHHDTAVEHPLRPKRRSLINFSRIGGLHASHGGSA